MASWPRLDFPDGPRLTDGRCSKISTAMSSRLLPLFDGGSQHPLVDEDECSVCPISSYSIVFIGVPRCPQQWQDLRGLEGLFYSSVWEWTSEHICDIH